MDASAAPSPQNKTRTAFAEADYRALKMALSIRSGVLFMSYILQKRRI
jgi:hypothetical protein